jgi:hypothetical protein
VSQIDAMRDLDAAIVGALAHAGFADAAAYTPPGGGTAVPCTVLVDRAAQFFGPAGEVVGTRIAVTLFLADVANPQQGGTVTVGDEAFELDELDEQDESKSRWVVVRG